MHHLLAAHLAGDVVQLGPDVVLVKRVVLAVLKESIFTAWFIPAVWRGDFPGLIIIIFYFLYFSI